MIRSRSSLIRFAVVALLLGCAAFVWAGAPPKDELKPIPTAEAEKQAATTRDFVIDVLQGGIDRFWHSGKWDQCIRLSRQTIELDPHDTEAYTDCAWVLSNLNRDEEAIATYRQGIEANPDQFDIYQQFGLFYHRRKKLNEAIEQFRKAAEHGAPRVWQHMLPRTLEQVGRKQEALDEWRVILKRFPDDKAAKARIAALERELGQKRNASLAPAGMTFGKRDG